MAAGGGRMSDAAAAPPFARAAEAEASREPVMALEVRDLCAPPCSVLARPVLVPEPGRGGVRVLGGARLPPVQRFRARGPDGSPAEGALLARPKRVTLGS